MSRPSHAIRRHLRIWEPFRYLKVWFLRESCVHARRYPNRYRSPNRSPGPLKIIRLYMSGFGFNRNQNYVAVPFLFTCVSQSGSFGWIQYPSSSTSGAAVGASSWGVLELFVASVGVSAFFMSWISSFSSLWMEYKIVIVFICVT